MKRLEDLAFAGVLVFFTSQILYATVLTLLCVLDLFGIVQDFLLFLINDTCFILRIHPAGFLIWSAS